MIKMIKNLNDVPYLSWFKIPYRIYV